MPLTAPPRYDRSIRAGHMFSQRPQPLHFAASTTGRRCPSKTIACQGHCSTQMAQPPEFQAIQRSVISARPMRTVSLSKGCKASVGQISTHLPQKSQYPRRKFITGVRAAVKPSPTPITDIGQTPRQRSHRIQRARKDCSSCAPGGRRSSSSEANRAIFPSAASDAIPTAAVKKSLRVRFMYFVNFSEKPELISIEEKQAYHISDNFHQANIRRKSGEKRGLEKLIFKMT